MTLARMSPEEADEFEAYFAELQGSLLARISLRSLAELTWHRAARSTAARVVALAEGGLADVHTDREPSPRRADALRHLPGRDEHHQQREAL